MKKVLIFVVLVYAFSSTYSQKNAREVIATSGGIIRFHDNSLSFTIGEPINETFGYNGLFLPQGFQQIDLSREQVEFKNETTETENSIVSENIEVSLYPNPASDFLNIDINSKGEFDAEIILYNAQGVKLINKNLESKKTRINLADMPNGTYFLRVISQENDLTETFILQIIK